MCIVKTLRLTHAWYGEFEVDKGNVEYESGEDEDDSIQELYLWLVDDWPNHEICGHRDKYDWNDEWHL